MSRIGRTCSVPTEACAYQVPRVPWRCEHLGQRIGVVGQVLERHRAVLDEADRLAVALQAHHDVEAGLAHLPQVLLRRRRRASRTTLPGRPRSPISSTSCASLGVSAALSSPANSTSRIAAGRPISAVSIVGRNAGLAQRQLDHRAVDQLDRGRPELDDVLRRVHRGVEGREVDDAEHLGARQLGASCSVRLCVKASVPSAPTSRCARLTLPSAV